MPLRFFIIALFLVVSGGVLVAYYVAGTNAGRGELMLPLDDTYIHFQYAKQLASGQPFVYNPGQPATSGATSLLYPVILAVGYLLGFQGLNLGLWAMIVGGVALFFSLLLIYELAKAFDAPEWLAVLAALAFALTGVVAWHYMSGMETGLMTLLVLTTLYTVITRRFWPFIVSAALLALMRPEGGALAVLAVVIMFIQRTRYIASLRKRRIWFLLVPVLMLGVQPLVNMLFTGSAVATGNSVKSILGTVPFYWEDVIRRILDNFVRMWAEWLSGSSPREGLYIWGGISILVVVGLVALIEKRERRIIGVLIVLWLLAGAGAISTLETAFWHFKRYQMPLMALFFPMAAWGMTWILDFIPHYYAPVRQGIFMLALLVVLRDTSATAFWQHFVLNGRYVYDQPYQMARWLQANTPADAVVAVHDVGMMRYMGGRTTLDMVGLTTPGAAAYWRNGPGSVAEFLIQQRPDYIASYGHGHGYGLGMIEDTSIYGEPLVTFPVSLDPNYNVALAADVQGVYQPDWENSVSQSDADIEFEGQTIKVEMLNIANLASEEEYNYHWTNSALMPGFMTEVYQLPARDCVQRCGYLDGVRRINLLESFWMPAQLGEAAILYTSLHAAQRGNVAIYVNNQRVDQNWIPEMPGRWLVTQTYIAPEYITTNPVNIRIEAAIPNGYYQPGHHMFLQNIVPLDQPLGQAAATYQNGSIQLQEATTTSAKIELDWYTDGSAQGDYKLFVHIIDGNGEIVHQVDRYPGNGTMPPGNWLPGLMAGDTIMINLVDIPPGNYQVAIGLYDPYTFERLQPESDEYEISDGRLFIGEIEVTS